MRKKLKVYVLMGGASPEHDISLQTAKKVIAALDAKKFEVKPALITRQGKWLVSRSNAARMLPNPSRIRTQGETSRALKPNSFDTHSLSFGQDSDANAVAFIAMHGPGGEDGTVQGLLELAGIPYTGSGVLASALAMDKVKSAEVFRTRGIAVPAFFSLHKTGWKKKRSKIFKETAGLGYPVVVKPRDQGSSVGITIVRSKQKLPAAITLACKYSPNVIIQKYILGREVTCAVIDKGIPGTEMPLQPTEIIPKTSKFFDYKAKYTLGASEEITPPKLPQAVIRKIQEAALRCHTALGCSGMSRTDMILAKSKVPPSPRLRRAGKGQGSKVYVLEVNTIPGMTETSLLPQAAKACGIEFPELLERIIEAGINRSRRG